MRAKKMPGSIRRSNPALHLHLARLEDKADAQAAGEIIEVSVTVPVAVVGPPCIRKDAHFLRLETELYTDAGVRGCPLEAIHCRAAARVNVRREAINREPGDEAAAEVVDGSLVSAAELVSVEPRGLNSDAEV
jgi:hypothetical protein